MKNGNKILLFLLTAFLLFSVSTPTLAVNVPDLSRKGSITVEVKDTESKTSVSGGSLTLYQIALAETDDGNYYFQYTESFKDCNLALDDIQTETHAEGYYTYVRHHNVKSMDKKEVSDGTAVFSNLELGLYLVVQEEAAEGYTAMAPFVISVPMRDGDSYIYDVDAAPKAGTVTPDKNTTTTTTTTTTEKSTQSHPGSKLPQTGQLWWPIPVLAFSGLLFFAYGWKRKHDA